MLELVVYLGHIKFRVRVIYAVFAFIRMNFTIKKLSCFLVAFGLVCLVFSQEKSSLKQIAPNLYEIGGVQIDSKNKIVSIPATVNITEGQIEYALVSTMGKLHESLLKTEVEPYHIHVAMLLLSVKGFDHSKYDINEKNIGGDPLGIKLEWNENGKTSSAPLEDFIFHTPQKTTLKRGEWVYNGSRLIEGTFLAQRDRSIIAIKADIDALINNPISCKENENDWVVNTNKFHLKTNDAVKVIIQLKSK